MAQFDISNRRTMPSPCINSIVFTLERRMNKMKKIAARYRVY